MQKLLNHWTRTLFVLVALPIALAGLAYGQAYETAQRGAEFSPFAEPIMLRPDWGPTSDIGIMAGVDYTRFISRFVQPSLEFRFTKGTGTTAGETTVSGGLKVQKDYGRIHPFVTVLGGYGRINFTPVEGTYSGDNSFVLSIGGGANIDVHAGWKVRVDFAEQLWNLEPYKLSPQTLGVGVSYAVPTRGPARLK
jgi:hypothetical protein